MLGIKRENQKEKYSQNVLKLDTFVCDVFKLFYLFFSVLATSTFLCRLKHRCKTEEGEIISGSEKIIVTKTKHQSNEMTGTILCVFQDRLYLILFKNE